MTDPRQGRTGEWPIGGDNDRFTIDIDLGGVDHDRADLGGVDDDRVPGNWASGNRAPGNRAPGNRAPGNRAVDDCDPAGTAGGPLDRTRAAFDLACAGQDAPAVLVHDLHRSFGSTDALRGVGLTAPYGRITGLAGPNGAGKSTLLLILATLLRPGHGRIAVGGHDPVTDPRAVRAITGWVGDSVGVDEHSTVSEYLTFFARAHRIPKAQAVERAGHLIDLIELAGSADRRVSDLSRGQRQLLAIGRALVNQPKVLLLDEPSCWLDPRASRRLRDLLRVLADGGTAVLMSSHLLDELEETADRVVLLDRGRAVGAYDMADLGTAAATGWRIRALDRQAMLAALAERRVAVTEPAGTVGTPAAPEPAGTVATPAAAEPPDGSVLLPPMTDPAAAALLAALVAAGVEICDFTRVETGLSATYRTLIEGAR